MMGLKIMNKVSDLFDVLPGHSLELNRLTVAERNTGVAFVSRRSGGNGIATFVEQIADLSPAPAGELTCALSGNGVLSTFLQEQPYYTGFHVARLLPLIPLTKAQLLYYSVCIKANRYRYSYGRQANRTLKEITIPGVDQLPDYIEAANLSRFEGLQKPITDDGSPDLNPSEWKTFTIEDLFDVRKGKRLTKAELRPGSTPFISALDNNNGLRQFIDAAPRHPAGVLTVNYNGNGVAEAYYQPSPFWASDDVNVLYPRFDGLSLLVGLFICSVIRREKYRFNYGRKWNLERMKISEIKLPVEKGGNLDIDLMERYMKTLTYSSALLTN